LSFSEVFASNDAMESKSRNALGTDLKSCCMNPVTGFFRDGICRTNESDKGSHLICAELTSGFLEFSRQRGNDLSTPRPEYGFRGLVAGDRWCLCASRWMEALEAGVAPRIYIESTHEKMLEWTDIETLKRFALDLS